MLNNFIQLLSDKSTAHPILIFNIITKTIDRLNNMLYTKSVDPIYDLTSIPHLSSHTSMSVNIPKNLVGFILRKHILLHESSYTQSLQLFCLNPSIRATYEDVQSKDKTNFIFKDQVINGGYFMILIVYKYNEITKHQTIYPEDVIIYKIINDDTMEHKLSFKEITLDYYQNEVLQNAVYCVELD